MVFCIPVRSMSLTWNINLTMRRARTLKLYSSVAGTSSCRGPPDGSEELSAVWSEKPPHTPVMLKEVLYYLDIQPAQVHLN